MKTSSIVNPKTGKQNQVKTWNIIPRTILDMMKAGTIKSAKDLSWLLLNDDESIQAMQDQMSGDAAESNFALAVFEQALDYALGIHVLSYIRNAVKIGKLPKPFQVAVNRKGDVFIITASGQII